MDKRFCDCCNKEIIPKDSRVWVVFHDKDLPQGRDLCLDCYRKIGEMVHIELPKETLLDAMLSSMANLAGSLRKALTGGRDESEGGGGHDQNRNEEGPEQSDQGDD